MSKKARESTAGGKKMSEASNDKKTSNEPRRAGSASKTSEAVISKARMSKAISEQKPV
jgi:hypothetical protein